MAKLNGVKTLDMVNGEVTKVEYNGEVYAKVDGVTEPKAGDIALNLQESPSYTLNAFYELRAGLTLWGSFGTVSDDQGSSTNGKNAKFWTVFRKVNASHSAEIYRLVTDREPKAGDFVKFSRDFTDIKAGKYYLIYEDGVGGLVIDDDAGDERRALLKSNRFAKFYEKVAKPETLTHNGATYTLVDRKAQPGDVVVFTAHEGSRFFTNGKPYGPVTKRMTVVDDEGGDILSVYSESNNRTPANVKVYEPQVAPAAVEKPLQVGDYAKVVPHNNDNSFGGKVGDIVKIVKEGTLPRYKTEELGGGNYGGNPWVKKEGVVRATDEEVAQAKAEVDQRKAEAVELSRWAAIGRKTNEFKEGDIVRHTSYRNLLGIVEGKNPTYSDTRYYVDFGEKGHNVCTEKTTDIELITPVEARFDLKGGQASDRQ